MYTYISICGLEETSELKVGYLQLDICLVPFGRVCVCVCVCVFVFCCSDGTLFWVRFKGREPESRR